MNVEGRTQREVVMDWKRCKFMLIINLTLQHWSRGLLLRDVRKYDNQRHTPSNSTSSTIGTAFLYVSSIFEPCLGLTLLLRRTRQHHRQLQQSRILYKISYRTKHSYPGLFETGIRAFEYMACYKQVSTGMIWYLQAPRQSRDRLSAS